MEDTMFCNLDISALISTCSEDIKFISVNSDIIIDKEWHLLEEDDDHVFLKNENNKVLFVKKIKKC
jgi:hypothetical protein